MNRAVLLLVLALSTSSALGSSRDLRTSSTHQSRGDTIATHGASSTPSSMGQHSVCDPYFTMPVSSSPIFNPDLIKTITIYQGGDLIDGFVAGENHTFVGAPGLVDGTAIPVSLPHVYPLYGPGENYVQHVQVMSKDGFVHRLLFATVLNSVLGAPLFRQKDFASRVISTSPITTTTWVAPPFHGMVGYVASSKYNDDPRYERVLVDDFAPLWAPIIIGASSPHPEPCRWPSSESETSASELSKDVRSCSLDTCVAQCTQDKKIGNDPTQSPSNEADATKDGVSRNKTPFNSVPACDTSNNRELIKQIGFYQGEYVRGLVAPDHPLVGSYGEFLHTYLFDYVIGAQVFTTNGFVNSIRFVDNNGQLVGNLSPKEDVLTSNITLFIAPSGYGMVAYNATAKFNSDFHTLLVSSFEPIFDRVKAPCASPPFSAPTHARTHRTLTSVQEDSKKSSKNDATPSPSNKPPTTCKQPGQPSSELKMGLNPDLILDMTVYQGERVYGVVGGSRPLVGSTAGSTRFHKTFITGVQVFAMNGFVSFITFISGDDQFVGQFNHLAGNLSVTTTMAPPGFGLVDYLATTKYDPSSKATLVSSFTPIFGIVNVSTSDLPSPSACANEATSTIVTSDKDNLGPLYLSDFEYLEQLTRSEMAIPIIALLLALALLLLRKFTTGRFL